MRDEWFRGVELPLTWEQFHELPRNPAYKYEYFEHRAWLTPRPKFYPARLRLTPCQPTTEIDAQWPVIIRPLRDDDWADLAAPFAGSFHRVVPFSTMTDDARQEAARECLEKVRNGGEGPLIRTACFVAANAKDESDTLGAILFTLSPAGDPSDWDANSWHEDPPHDAIERGLGRPHLTWIFVAPLLAGRGVGTALLSNAIPQLLTLGYSELNSTILSGNDSSLLWHWRCGFELLEYPGSYRRMFREIRRSRLEPDR